MIDKKRVIDEIDPEHLVEIVEEQLEAERGIKFYWREGDPDPPWIPDRDRRYVQKMTDWVHWHLDRAPVADQEPNPPDVSKRQLELLKEDGPEIAAAERGDISPLRKKWPRFARFLYLAKREHGQRFASLPWNDHDRAKLAAIMAGEITALWQKHYDGKKVRRFPPSAVEIAAERWDVKVADVERWVRRLKKEAKKR